MAELVDAQDLKSCGHCDCTGSIPVPGTRTERERERRADVTILFLALFLFIQVFHLFLDSEIVRASLEIERIAAWFLSRFVSLGNIKNSWLFNHQKFPTNFHLTKTA